MCLHLSGLASQTLTYHHFIDIHMPKHMTQVRRKKVHAPYADLTVSWH